MDLIAEIVEELQNFLTHKPKFPSIHYPRICFGGINLSVQANQYAYSKPRDNVGPWTQVELGFPCKDGTDKKLPFPEYLNEYGDDDVRGYVPLKLLARWIAESSEPNSISFITNRKSKPFFKVIQSRSRTMTKGDK